MLSHRSGVRLMVGIVTPEGWAIPFYCQECEVAMGAG